MKKSAAAWTSEKGSAQVVEFSYVFPVVLLTVVGLLYLLFLLFFYVYAFHATETVADSAAREVGNGRVYWQLSTHSLDTETTENCAAALEQKLHAMEVLPGLNFQTSFQENATGSRVTAEATCSFRGKKLFTVRSVRALRKPTEFAENVDLAETMAKDIGLKEFLQKKFEAYIPK